jgi:minor histocompatibility antigen H13
MMVTVAKSLDIPIKILIPRPPDADDPSRAFGMLGLGDIVLPGFMIGMALRFDLYLHYLRLQRTTPSEKEHETAERTADENLAPKDENAVTELRVQSTTKLVYTPPIRYWSSRLWTSSRLLPPMFASGSFRKTYFTMSFLGYIVGMIATEAAMHYADHPQPALLYLVPAVLISLLLTAAIRGELQLMWDYTEEEEDDDEAAGDKKTIKNGANSSEKKPRESFFSPSRPARVAEKIASAVTVPETGAGAKGDGGDQPASLEDQSTAIARETSLALRRDRERDIVFFSVGKSGPWASRISRRENGSAEKLAQGGPKWVVPPHEREEPTVEMGHAGKRLRTA